MPPLINASGFKMILDESLLVHSQVSGVDQPTITGIYVVGSTLTDDFSPQESDIDIYIEVEEQYSQEEGFLRLINDTTESWNTHLQEYTKPSVSCVDVLGMIETNSTIRDPFKYYEL